MIAGGGLAGCLAALAMARLRPEIPLLLLEGGESFGGNHIWSFFDADVAPDQFWLVEPLVAKRWDSYDIAFPARRRTLPTGYNSIRSTLLDGLVRERLRPDQYRLRTSVARLETDRVELADGSVIDAAGVIDARGFGNLDALDLGWQKFVGRDYVLRAPHGLERPIVMDANVAQHDGYRFVYCLPFADDRIFVEDTYYSIDPTLDRGAIGARIDSYMEAKGWVPASMEGEEEGVLPVTMGGDFDLFWPAGSPARMGVSGGFFHPVTGYSLPDAVRTAMLLAAEPSFEGAGLSRMLRVEAKQLWRERAFYRLLNRMLFRAAEPDQRYRVLEHFYRLDPDLVTRFYAGRSGALDKIRIVSGKPPVAVGKALAALWK